MSNDGRHSSDYERMERQQQALTVLSSKLASIRIITRINHIMNILSANVKTSLSVEELDALIKKFYSIDVQGLETTSLQGGGYLINGAWYEIVPDSEIERIQGIIKAFYTKED
jgi:polyisoprenyl-teichoic acid--peptidoglycan teichoic acid transferase